ncbi:unnamed protein product [Mycena citricolor]|uniref:DUF218 domain-containing protein n=1 Tax=Mycena citricolor TaxID=2018698 RepID=A0AAD2HQQ8_9AGAR|nr:unnamed protein product [Mycena citricolor]
MSTPTAPDPLDADAALVYDYHRLHETPTPSDALLVLCSLDTRVAHHAAQLYLAGLAPLLVFSGGVGALTAGRFAASEAAAFAAVARSLGVPDSAILLEPHSCNTGENVRLTHALLRDAGLLAGIRRVILVQKPYMERRTYATFVKQWPGSEIQIQVTSPPLDWAEYPDAENPRDLVVNVMVGDLVRIREYAALGFQIAQDIPADVWAAGQRLIEAGYDQHLPQTTST